MVLRNNSKVHTSLCTCGDYFHKDAEYSCETKTLQSLNTDFDKGVAGIYLTHPNGEPESFRIPMGKISSNFTYKLWSLKEFWITTTAGQLRVPWHSTVLRL
ncbi:hypothetical protein TNCV_4099921 [Trichonephila clavipes]|nr:hypothetical protein TNCV_4099921 [Trichonephila clavipes]